MSEILEFIKNNKPLTSKPILPKFVENTNNRMVGYWVKISSSLFKYSTKMSAHI